MKILQVATGFPIRFPGGVTNYVRTLMRDVRSKGHQVDVLAGTAPPAASADDFADHVHPFAGVSSVFCLSLDRNNDVMTAEVKALMQQYDIVHFHMNYGMPASFYESIPDVPYVVSLHDYGYICPRIFMVDKWGETCNVRDLNKCCRCVGALEQINLFRAAANRMHLTLPSFTSGAALRRAERMDRFLRGARIRLAVSARVAQIYQDATKYDDYRVVHIGNDTAREIQPRDSWMPEGKVRCCFLGTMNKAKGAEVLLNLLKRLPKDKFAFSFWGRGEKAYLNALAEQGVVICGSYKPDQLTKILHDVDVGLVLPTWHDNGPQVLMEFINNGIPVLGTDMGGVPDFLTNTTGFLFNPSDGLDAAAAWLVSLSSERLQELHKNIRPLKTPVQHADEINAIYENLVGSF